MTLTSTVEIGSRPYQQLAERVLCRFFARQSDVLLGGLANRLETPPKSHSAKPYSGYGPAPAINWTYDRDAQRYRDLYYRLHAEADGPIDRVRRAVTEGASANAVLVRTADHGDLLCAHGGLHRNGSTSTTRPPAFRSSSLASVSARRNLVSSPRRHRMSTCPDAALSRRRRCRGGRRHAG